MLVDGVYEPSGDLDDLAVPETLTALIAARLDGFEPDDRALICRRSGPGPDASAIDGAWLAFRESSRPTLESRARCARPPRAASTPRSDPALAGARPVRVRPGAHPRGRLQHAVQKDRKVRHLAAARFFESLGTDEIAGALAGHYLAAYASAPDGAEADALAAQARIALRAAAERAIALGVTRAGVGVPPGGADDRP